jgi:hypothetical protein
MRWSKRSPATWVASAKQGHLLGGAQLGPQRHGANGHMQPDGLVVELEAAAIERLPRARRFAALY